MQRLFIAIRPPAPVRDALIDTMEGLEGARWQGEDQLHLTLRFVGEVETPLANDLAEALGEVRCPAFALRIAGVGHFARRGAYGSHSKALWAAIAPCETLDLLQRRVERACRAAGLAPETRKFVPHITLARLNSGTRPIGDWLAHHGKLSTPEWPVDEFRLYESRLGKSGAAYEAVVAYRLRS